MQAEEMTDIVLTR